MFTGVGTQKNSLGKICLISGIYILWKILFEKRDREGSFKLERAIDIVIIFLTIWLLYLSKSATAFTCLAAVVCMFIIAKAKNISKNPDRLLYIGIVGFSLVILLEISIDLSAVLLSILNRDASLTTRVPIWEFLLEIEINKFIGTGYYSFWMGDRLQEIWEFTGKTINQAHNGYLEQYLNLGYIGLALTVIIIINGIITIRNELKIDYTLGILKLGFFFVAILYNFTEAAFYGLNNIWILFILSIIKINHENFKDQCKHQNLEAK
jgi:O-antigen ligase